jgi:hypothetical protein
MASGFLGVGVLFLGFGLFVVVTTTDGTQNIGRWLAAIGFILLLAWVVGNLTSLWRRRCARKRSPTAPNP